MAAGQTVLRVEAGEDFIVTPFIESVCRRGMAYLELRGALKPLTGGCYGAKRSDR